MIYSACGTIVLAKGDKPAWLIIKVPDDLGRYYGRFHKLQQPLNGTHITIVAGEKEGFADASRLKPYVGRQVNLPTTVLFIPIADRIGSIVIVQKHNL